MLFTSNEEANKKKKKIKEDENTPQLKKMQRASHLKT